MSRNPGIMNRLQANIKTILKKWKYPVTLKDIAGEYGCATGTLRRAIQRKIGMPKYKQISAENFRAGHAGNTQKLYADLDQIEQRFRANEGMANLIAEYHVSPVIMTKALLTRMTRDEYREINCKTIARGGKKTRFAKGQPAWNKDVKGIHLSPETEFQKGHKPHNTKYDRCISIRTHRGLKTRWIRIAEGKWVPFAIWLWEKHNGPVPEGMLVAHIDGNSLGDRIGNLELSTRADHLYRNVERDPDGTRRRKSKAMKAAWKKCKKQQRQKEKEIAKRQRAKSHQSQIDATDKQIAAEAISSARRQDRVLWMCTSCGHTYNGTNPPDQCTKCNRGGFEKNVIPQRLVI